MRVAVVLQPVQTSGVSLELIAEPPARMMPACPKLSRSFAVVTGGKNVFERPSPVDYSGFNARAHLPLPFNVTKLALFQL